MKTCTEWSEGFNLLWNNIASNKAPGLEEYEKSVFLTLGQEQLVHDFFTARSNPQLEGFDASPKRQADFSTLIDAGSMISVQPAAFMFDPRSVTKRYKYPSDVFVSLNESIIENGATDSDVRVYTVVPLSFEEYQLLMKKPYKYPPKGQVWRLITGSASSEGIVPDTVVEIIGRFTGTITYNVRYVKRPDPIILEDLDESMPSIEGKRMADPCHLPEHLHSEILYRAVMLAKLSWNDAPAPTAQNQR